MGLVRLTWSQFGLSASRPRRLARNSIACSVRTCLSWSSPPIFRGADHRLVPALVELVVAELVQLVDHLRELQVLRSRGLRRVHRFRRINRVDPCGRVIAGDGGHTTLDVPPAVDEARSPSEPSHGIGPQRCISTTPA